MMGKGQVLFGASSNVELEQTFLRLLLVFIGTVYGVTINYLGVLGDENLTPVVALGCFYVVFSAASILHVYLRPDGHKWRHSVYMGIDILVTSIVMHYFGKYGVPFFVFYLWLTVGNGFRYGHMQLMLCAGMSLCGFAIMSVFTPYWHEEYLLTVTNVMLLSIVPMYVAIMLERLQEAKDSAVRANQEKTRFLANVSHEIRTPLNAVAGFSQMLDREMDDVRRAQITRSIRDASASLTTLVEGVLDLSRIESGHVQIKEETFNLYGLIRSVEGMFSMHAEQGGVRYITDMDITLPPRVRGDVDHLRQILVNLVGNAVKFTSVGEIKIRISCPQHGDGSRQILFEVIDTGVGIPSAMQSRIFERFQQADDSVQRRYGGTGLGTSIAKRLVDLMGGQIGLESEENKGSRFWFHIPLIDASGDQRAGSTSEGMLPVCCAVGARLAQDAVPAIFGGMRVFENWVELDRSDIDLGECCVIVDSCAVTDVEIDDVIRQGHKSGSCLVALCEDAGQRDDYLRAGFHLVIESGEQIENVLVYASRILDTHMRDNLEDDLAIFLESGKKLNVLVTDDCRLNRHVMKAMLDDLGIESDFASSGPMALEKLRSGTYDLMVLDIQMPGMSGFDVIELYRSRTSEDVAIPIFVVTGDATTEIYEKCERLGVSRFLLKPVDQEKLRFALTSLVTISDPDPGIV
jgi:two-component system sensor histidine kinase RpfC